MTFDALDDFAGPGGWDEGARMVGLRPVGVEWDQCALRHSWRRHGGCGTTRMTSTLGTRPFVGSGGFVRLSERGLRTALLGAFQPPRPKGATVPEPSGLAQVARVAREVAQQAEFAQAWNYDRLECAALAAVQRAFEHFADAIEGEAAYRIPPVQDRP